MKDYFSSLFQKIVNILLWYYTRSQQMVVSYKYLKCVILNDIHDSFFKFFLNINLFILIGG